MHSTRIVRRQHYTGYYLFALPRLDYCYATYLLITNVNLSLYVCFILSFIKRFRLNFELLYVIKKLDKFTVCNCCCVDASRFVMNEINTTFVSI